MNEFDPWKLSDSGGLSDDHGKDAFKTEVIENVEPLDRQFGVQPKKSVPGGVVAEPGLLRIHFAHP